LHEKDAYTLHDSAQRGPKTHYTFDVHIDVLVIALNKIHQQERQYRELNYTMVALKIGNRKVNYNVPANVDN